VAVDRWKTVRANRNVLVHLPERELLLLRCDGFTKPVAVLAAR
jgi:hypothetical protein